MSITRKLIHWTTLSGLVLATAFTSTSAFADLSTTNPSSYPQFRSNVTIKQEKVKGQLTNAWSISGSAGSFYTSVLDSDIYSIKGGGKFTATVNWTPLGGGEGSFSSGSLSIDGKINGQSILMTASLISYEWDSGTSSLGFNTDSLFCSASLTAIIGSNGCNDFGREESLIITLKNGWDGLELALPNKGLGGTAITSVPLPAAAWLFISGLGLMGVTVRRKNRTTTI